ncbi:MAG: tRNA 2-thiouridine(34) synthase MnmA, partial [Pseudonocardia sp.]|nr:tRNA 2-thiouridine(34) synthase MnmA [Pseudonocardia sp.]
PAAVHVRPDGVAIELAEPLRGVAPGQTAAFYRPDPGGDLVLGSARIAATA